MITLTSKEWTALAARITEEHGHSVMLLRMKMRETLGCTLRYGDTSNWPSRTIYLDFYNDMKETFFRMKYL